MSSHDSSPLFDSEEVRTRAAWFSEGANTVTQAAFFATFISGSMMGLMVAILDINATDAVITFSVLQLCSLAAIGWYLGVRSREIAKKRSVQIDRF